MAREDLIGRLKAKREKIAQKHTITLPIPGYDGELAVRYVWKPYEEVAANAANLQKVKNPTRRELLAAADVLVKLCEEVVIPNPDYDPDADYADDQERDAAKWASLSEDGDAIRFDERLGETLDFEAETAREHVLGAFQNDYAVLNAALMLSAWLQDATQEVDSVFEGS